MTHFFRPRTLELPRAPKYARRSVVTGAPRLDEYSILKFPLTTESSMKKIEDNNTLVFIVDLTATKKQIAAAVKRMYGVSALKVNTLVRYVSVSSFAGVFGVVVIARIRWQRGRDSGDARLICLCRSCVCCVMQPRWHEEGLRAPVARPRRAGCCQQDRYHLNWFPLCCRQ